MNYPNKTIRLLLFLIFISAAIGLIEYSAIKPKPPVVFEFREYKQTSLGHRYEVYHHEQRVGYVVMPDQMCGIDSVVVAVND